MEALHALVNDINNILWSYVLIIVLIGAGVWFTFSTEFVQIRFIKDMFTLLLEDAGTKMNGKAISPFQAFCVSTASRVGVGNIAGVAIAVVLGGPGAVFWMWLIAFIGCASGFMESTLAQIYKIPAGEGSFRGGPAFYIENALHMPVLARVFAVLLAVTFGLVYVSVQSNTMTAAAQTAFGVDPLVFGIGITVLTALVICGGLHRIARVADKMVPLMAGLYILAALAVIIMNIDQVPSMFAMIIHDAFSPQAAVGGGIGAVALPGIKRGLFSNEAGEGSVPNAAATATTSHPAKQGLLQAFGVYVDTWLICTASAFIVLLGGQYEIGGQLTGIELAQKSLAINLGDWAVSFLAFIVLLFAFSSVVGNYSYGEINVHLVKENHRKLVLNIFRLLVVVFAFIGSQASLGLVWDMADLFMGFLTLTNLYALFRLYPMAMIALRDYSEQKRRGIKSPTFNPNIMPSLDGIHAWGVDAKRNAL